MRQIHFKRILKFLLPSCASQTSQNQTFLIVGVGDGIRRLETLSDPVALLQRVDEHELDPNLVAVGVLQAI